MKLGSPPRAIVVPSFEPVMNAVQELQDRWHVWRGLRGHTQLSDSSREGSRVYARGIVRADGEMLVAPLSALPCLAYRSRAWPTGSRQTAGNGPHELTRLRPFTLELGDDAVGIDGEHAILALPRVRLGNDSSERKASFLARHGSRDGYLGESILQVGARVTIGGMLVLRRSTHTGDREAGYRDPRARRWLVGDRDNPLVIRS